MTTKLDEIENKWKLDLSNDALSPGDIPYLLKIAREAEKMAKIYSNESNWVTHPVAIDEQCVFYPDGDGYEIAKEFLKLLEGK